jgi:hypothetical protein
VTQPDHVPLKAQDRIRPSDRLGLPGTWVQDRPAELTGLTPPVGEQFGVTGPDLGFGLKLAKRFLDRLVLTEGEDPHDALAGCFACGTRRAASFGRAPVIYDMEWAYTLWGYLAQAPAELVALRVPLFRGAGHDVVVTGAASSTRWTSRPSASPRPRSVSASTGTGAPSWSPEPPGFRHGHSTRPRQSSTTVMKVS